LVFATQKILGSLHGGKMNIGISIIVGLLLSVGVVFWDSPYYGWQFLRFVLATVSAFSGCCALFFLASGKKQTKEQRTAKIIVALFAASGLVCSWSLSTGKRPSAEHSLISYLEISWFSFGSLSMTQKIESLQERQKTIQANLEDLLKPTYKAQKEELSAMFQAYRSQKTKPSYRIFDAKRTRYQGLDLITYTMVELKLSIVDIQTKITQAENDIMVLQYARHRIARNIRLQQKSLHPEVEAQLEKILQTSFRSTNTEFYSPSVTEVETVRKEMWSELIGEQLMKENFVHLKSNASR